MRWGATPNRHVVPIGDFRDHDVDGECWCNPRNDEGVIVHNSLDGREAYELDYAGPLERRVIS